MERDNSVGEGYKHRAPPEQGPKQQNKNSDEKISVAAVVSDYQAKPLERLKH